MISCYRLQNGTWKRYDIITKWQSAIWTKRFFSVGSVQIELQSTEAAPYDIVVQGENAGIILKIVKNWDKCTLYGYDLKGITAFRTLPAETISNNTNAEAKIKAWAQSCLARGNKAIEGLSVAAFKNLPQLFSETEISSGKLSDILENQTKQLNMGWDITFSGGLLSFDVINPQDRSEIVLSKMRRNIENSEYIADEYDTVNSTPDNVGSQSGIRLREGEELTEGSEYITAEANSNLSIGTDYNLGDTVTVMEHGFASALQVSEVKFVYEPNNFIVVPTFGEAKKNIIKKLMR